MKTLSQEEFANVLQHTTVKLRTKKELKFATSTVLYPKQWSDFEFIAISDRTMDKGILLLQPDDTLFVAEYQLVRRIVDSGTGRDRAVICDLCYTWQPGSNAATITFTHATNKHTVGFLCCADLMCSQHVRTATKAAIVSRARLRENMTNEDRIARLKSKLREKIEQLDLQATDLS